MEGHWSNLGNGLRVFEVINETPLVNLFFGRKVIARAKSLFSSEFEVILESEKSSRYTLSPPNSLLWEYQHYHLNGVVAHIQRQFLKENRKGEAVGSGTGFLVSSNGLVVTNHHVINGANEITVTVPTGEAFTAEVVSASASTDLALLRIPYQTKIYLTSEQPGSVKTGNHVFTLGFPVSDLLGKELKYTDGSISSLSGFEGDATFYQMSVPIQPGNSGGPLINEIGNVVGIVTSTAAVEAFYQATGSLPQNVNWAVKGVYASLLLPPGIEKAERSTDNPITNAKWSVVYIETK